MSTLDISSKRKTRQGLALTTQLRVIRALILQEIELLRGPLGLGFVAVLLEPVLHLSVICFWHWIVSIRPIYGTSKVLFLATGLYPIFIFIHVASQGRMVSKSSKRRFPIETNLDVLIASSVVKFVSYVFIGFVLFGGIAIFFTDQGVPSDWGAVISTSAALGLLGFAMGLVNTAVEPVFPLWHDIFGPVVRVMALFSGVLFVSDTYLSPPMRYWLSWNPVLHGVEHFRQAFYPEYPKLIYSGEYLWTWATCLLIFGLLIDRATRDAED